MELAQLMILVGFVGTSSMLFYVITNLCLKLVGIHAREYNTNADASETIIVTTYISKTCILSTSSNKDKIPIGLVIGKWYIAYVSTINIQKRDSVSIGYSVIFWASNLGHTKVSSDDDIENQKTNVDESVTPLNTLGVWRHSGSYKSDAIKKIQIFFYNYECAQQTSVIDRMKNMAQMSCDNGFGNRLVVMMSGPSGTGKSQIAKQFAKSINATLCDDFNPTYAGENFVSLIETIKPTRKNPLVILFDEGDKIITKIHTETLKDHEFFVTPVVDKASYNTFMDRIGENDNVFVIFTMNSRFNDIDALDKSYTRSCRIDLKINFGGDESYNPSYGDYMHIKPFENIASNTNKMRFEPKFCTELIVDAYISQESDIEIGNKKGK